MTTLNVAAASGELQPSQQIARRIRGILAENRITGLDLASALDMPQRAVYRRLSEEVTWSIDELSTLARVLNLPFEDLVRHEGLEPPTRWLTPSSLEPLEQLADVLEFRLPGGVRRPRPRPSLPSVRPVVRPLRRESAS